MQRGFSSTPALLGVVSRIDARGERRALMVMQRFMQNQGDAWSWTSAYLERIIDELAVGQDTEKEPAFAAYDAFAQAFGRRLAEMHAALALPSDDPAFSPRTAGRDDVRAWTAGVRAELDAAMQALERAGSWRQEEVAAMARGLLARRAALSQLVGGLAEAGAGAPLTRIHGDLHLGQVLVTAGDAAIIDFEGEPSRPMAARRAKNSPLRDVAGALRSFDYAAAMIERNLAPEPKATEKRLGPLLARFRASASSAFLAGYAEAGAPAPGPLLDLFLVEKAAYEIVYESSSRPDWLDVPVRGLAQLADRLLGAA
jgi:maltose alpha-D-glucosyltransferase/alpha-amylase